MNRKNSYYPNSTQESEVWMQIARITQFLELARSGELTTADALAKIKDNYQRNQLLFESYPDRNVNLVHHRTIKRLNKLRGKRA